MKSEPWKTEPDRVEWRSHGLPCLILRGPLGALCGYVAVPPGHALHGAELDDERMWSVPTHGGVTYTGKCQEDGHICHVPQPGEPDDVWWIGFDCSHSGDLCPRMSLHYLSATDQLGNVYRDIPYVRSRLEEMAKFLSEVQP